MSDYAEYTIILYEEDILQIKEIFEISLNIIFFHRYLGNNDYQDVQSKINKISYVKVKNEKLSKDIDKIINQIEKNFENNTQYGQLFSLKFYEKEKNKKNLKYPWEIWNFILILSRTDDVKDKKVINNKKETYEDDGNKENKIREYIFKIIEKLNDKENYMPNINLDDKSLNEESFFYDKTIENISTKDDYFSLFSNYLKKKQENIIVINHLP